MQADTERRKHPRAAAPPGGVSPGGLLAALLGVVLFVYFVRRAGVGEIAGGVRNIGWWFLLILLLSGVRFAFRAAAWVQCLDGPYRLRVVHALEGTLAGDALGNLTPLGLLVGEPAKAVFVRHRAPLARTFPALAVENFFYTLSVAIVIVAGLLTLLFVFQPPGAWWVVLAAVAGALAGLLGSAHWILSTRLPVASASVDWLDRRRLAPAWLTARRARIAGLEARMHALYARSRGRLVPLALLEGAFHAAGIAEVYLTLALIGGGRPTLVDAFILESANRLINAVFRFVPLRLGVDEAGTGMFADLLRYGTTAGVTLAIVRKARMLVWITVGILLLVRRGLNVSTIVEDPELARVRESLEEGGSSASDPESAIRNPQSAIGDPQSALRHPQSTTVIAIMARSPAKAPAAIKTRLAPAIPAEADRQALYGAFLADAIATVGSLPGVARRLACTPEGGAEGFAALDVPAAELMSQRGDDLGARERHLFEDLFAEGFEIAILIGSDLPALPPGHITTAVDTLRTSDRTVVLGPTDDGGYYLMGMCAPRGGEVPDLFTGIHWSTASVFEETVQAAARAGWTVALAPPWHDVDDPDALDRLRRDLLDPTVAARAPATTAAVRRIFG